MVGLPIPFDYVTSMLIPVRTPTVLLPSVWPLPLSLAATNRISFDFSSSAYLDVSLRRVPLLHLCIQYRIHGSSPWGFPHSDIPGSTYLQLPEAYRSLSRPSSAPDAKAFTLRSSSLELPIALSFSIIFSVVVFNVCHLCDKIVVNLPFSERPSFRLT